MITLAQLFTNNHEYLNTVATRITRCKDRSLAPELISCTYLYLVEKNKEVPNKNEDFVKFFSTYMKNFFEWPNSDFNKSINTREYLTIDEHEFQIPDESALIDIELMAEETNEFTKKIIEISSNIGKDKTLKYIETVEFKRTLSEPDKILFELYFEKELSTRKIATLYSDEVHKMNYQSVNQMVNKIKTKINKYKWKQ